MASLPSGLLHSAQIKKATSVAAKTGAGNLAAMAGARAKRTITLGVGLPATTAAANIGSVPTMFSARIALVTAGRAVLQVVLDLVAVAAARRDTLSGYLHLDGGVRAVEESLDYPGNHGTFSF
jgi:hypothetical protein